MIAEANAGGNSGGGGMPNVAFVFEGEEESSSAGFREVRACVCVHVAIYNTIYMCTSVHVCAYLCMCVCYDDMHAL